MSDTNEIDDLVQIGRGWVTPKLLFVGTVTGGGAHGPGNVFQQTDYDHSVGIRWSRDDRSGSRRSGSCGWQLSADKLYQLVGIADGSRSSGNYHVSTFGGGATRLTRAEFDAERARIWPLGKQLADEAADRARIAEEERIKRDAERAEQRRVEAEALKELNAERAAEIAEHGQPEGDLPVLTGTPKQIAYALSIRGAYAAKHPGDAALKRGTTAKYWIENHRNALYR